MNANEFKSLDGLELATLVKKGEVSPFELMQCAIELATKADRELGFLCHERFDESLEIARTWERRGQFQGIPFLLKDSALPSRRFPSSLGSRLFKDTHFAIDSTLVERFDAAGFISFARSTVPEFCMAPATEANVYGHVTRNPWALDRSPGGSSGGAAVAVAAGVVPVAHGSDGGGSIRVPAAACGLYGFKASRGLVPMGPLRGEGWGGLAVDGVLSRTVRDTAAAMDEIKGADAGAPYAAPTFERSFLDTIGASHRKRLRIAVWRQPFSDIRLAPEVLAGLEATVAICKDLGHEVIDVQTPAFDYEGFITAHTNILAANIVNSVDAKLLVQKATLRPDDLEMAIMTGYEYGKTLRADTYIKAINVVHQVGRSAANWMNGIDVLMTPALNRLPALHGELAMNMEFPEFRRKMSEYSNFFAIINASGQPAASLPTYWTKEGIPVGTQIIGSFGCDDLVLRLSAEIEATGKWHPQHHNYQL